MGKSPPSILQARHDFPMLTMSMHGKPLVYLDTAATAQKPQCVIDAISNFYRENYGTVHRAVYALSLFATEEYQHVRQKIQSYLHAAKPEEVIFTRGSTESINLVAYSFGKAFVKPGDEIIVSAIEHHANIVPWQILCEDRGAILKVASVNDQGEIILEEFQKLLSPRCKLVAVGHISNVLGTVHPIKMMAKMAHAVGAKLLVDGAQAAPHLMIDVQDLDVDFYVFSGHKLYGPTGIGILYGKEELLNAMPPAQGGGDMISHVTFEKTTYNTLPLKFEAGTPMIAEVIGLGAAVDYVLGIGLDSIHQWEQTLLLTATDKMLEIPGLRIIGTAQDKGAIISFVVEGTHPLDIGTLLDLKGIAIRTGHHCSQPTMKRFGVEATARASFGLYNTMDDVIQFVESLKQAIKQLR